MLNIVIPMAGQGSRFIKAGYIYPKPFIDVDGKRMICRVVDNMRPVEDVKFTFIARTEHKDFIDKWLKGHNVVYVDKLTEGAACTVLEGIKDLNPEEEMIIINSDQLIDWPEDGIQSMIDYARDRDLDGCISVFNDNKTNLSYAKCDEWGMVTEVAEKKVISDLATAGTYYFKRVRDFSGAAKEMISRNIRTNNEFYVCPVYNTALEMPYFLVATYLVPKVHELGTPEGLVRYLDGQ